MDKLRSQSPAQSRRVWQNHTRARRPAIPHVSLPDKVRRVPGGAQKKLAEELEDSLDRELYSPGARAHQEEEEEEVVLLEPQQGAQGQLVHQAQQGRASDSEEEREREGSEEGSLSDNLNLN